MQISAWWLIPLAIPVLLLGEVLVRRVKLLSRFSIPVPVVGGFLFALATFALNATGTDIAIDTKVAARWWTWIVTPEVEWWDAPAKTVYEPLVVAFFTCVGLNASWRVARTGSWQLLLFLGLATALAVIQNGVGIALAKAMGVSPYLGLLCGSTTMTGGHGTAMGFRQTFEDAGFAQAGVVGAAAATFGLVAGCLMGGPIGTRLIRKHALEPGSDAVTVHGAEDEGDSDGGILWSLRTLLRPNAGFWFHLAILLACMKIGAWVSWGMRQMGLTFPIYMGAMLTGIIIRNLMDALRPDPADEIQSPAATTPLPPETSSGGTALATRVAPTPTIRTDTVDLMASVLLGLFLTMAMMSLNLIELTRMAGPMLVILATQATIMAAFAYFVTFRVMGGDYAAAIMAGGHCGFGLGATPNAVANMEALTERFGHSPRAFLVVTIVGAFLIDFTNAMNITTYLNFLK